MEQDASLLNLKMNRRRLAALGTGLAMLAVGSTAVRAADPTSTPAPSAAGAAEATPSGSPAASPIASPVATGPLFEASMQGLKFLPPEIDIEAGTTVTWVNKDVVAHTVTHRAPPKDQLFASPYLNPGERFSYTFDEPGTYGIMCIPHPFMSQTVVVSEKKA